LPVAYVESRIANGRRSEATSGFCHNTLNTLGNYFPIKD
jgi:hypothetical protein